MRIFVWLALVPVLFLAACAAPLTGAEMMPNSRVYDQLDANALNKNISLHTVVADLGLGGIAPVVSDQYKEALALGLRQAGWYAPDNSKSAYSLDAHMTKISQPFIGFDFTVTSVAEYSLVKTSSGKVVYSEVLTLPCTTGFSEAFNADVRMRKATACSVGENIAHLLKVLSQRY